MCAVGKLESMFLLSQEYIHAKVCEWCLQHPFEEVVKVRSNVKRFVSKTGRFYSKYSGLVH